MFKQEQNEKNNTGYGDIIDSFEILAPEIEITIKQASGLGYSVLVEPNEISNVYADDGIFDRASESFTVYLLKKVAE